MKNKKTGPCLSKCLGLCIPLAVLIVVANAQIELPKTPFPIGLPDLIETRSLKELRPGLTHVHVERGIQHTGERPKIALGYGTHDAEESARVRDGFEGLGLKVNLSVTHGTQDSKPHYYLSAGEFDTLEEAMKVVYKVPVGVHLAHIGEYKEGSGPYVLEIVILDPKSYRGKIVSAWSGSNWRSSPLELALKHNAVVAINGGWFEYSRDDISGVPSGISIVEGIWHHEHVPENYPHTKQEGIIFLNNTPQKGPSLSIGDAAPPFPQLKWGKGKSTTLDGIDRMPKLDKNELVAMQEQLFWHSQFSHVHPKELLSLRKIEEASSGAGLFLLATGNKRSILEETKESWDEVTLDLSVTNSPGLSAVFTYNVLIKEGQRPKVNYGNGATARTAIGADAEGKIYLITALINTSEYHSKGASLPQLQDIGEYLGLINLANLDGGPLSASMVIEGRPVGDPKMQIYDDERRVADSILIIDDR